MNQQTSGGTHETFSIEQAHMHAHHAAVSCAHDSTGSFSRVTE
jgi:hypothetical protein